MNRTTEPFSVRVRSSCGHYVVVRIGEARWALQAPCSQCVARKSGRAA